LDHAATTAFAAGVHVLTLFAFPEQPTLGAETRAEVLSLYGNFLSSQALSANPDAPRVQVFGRRDRLPKSVLRAVRKAEAVPRAYGAPLLRIGLDYDAREAVDEARAILETADVGCTFAEAMALAVHEPAPVPPPDVVVVTGGVSNTERVLYWEPLYANVRYLNVLWPDFDCAGLAALIEDARNAPTSRRGRNRIHHRSFAATRICLRH